MPAKPRMEPLAGSGWEGGCLAWVCSGLDAAGAPRPAQLSPHEEAAFPGSGWGEGPASQRTSVLITTHKSFSFIDIPEYARNTEMLPRGPVRPRKCQSDCEFCPFSPLPLPAIDRPLSRAWTTVGDFQPPDSFQTIPYPAIVQPSLFLPSSLPCPLPPHFFPPFLLPFPLHLPLLSFLPTSLSSRILTLHLLCAKHSGSNTVAAKTDPRASVLVGEADSDQPAFSGTQPELRLFEPSLS